MLKKKEKKGLKIPKGTLKAVNRGTGNTVTKRKKGKTTNNDACTQDLTCGIRRVAPVTNR